MIEAILFVTVIIGLLPTTVAMHKATIQRRHVENTLHNMMMMPWPMMEEHGAQLLDDSFTAGWQLIEGGTTGGTGTVVWMRGTLEVRLTRTITKQTIEMFRSGTRKAIQSRNHFVLM